MIGRDNRRVMVIISSYHLGFKNNLGYPCDCAKMVRLGGVSAMIVICRCFSVFGVWCVKFCT